MKRKYMTDLTKFGPAIAEQAYIEIRDQFKMLAELEGCKVYHQRKMTRREQDYLRGFLSALTLVDYGN